MPNFPRRSAADRQEMIPIDKEQLRPSTSSENANYHNTQEAAPAAPDATQRVWVSQYPEGTQTTPPRRTTPSTNPVPSRRTPPAHRRKKSKTLPLVLMIAAAVLLVGILIGSVFMFTRTDDDGLILDNVFAAGVNLGGMTPEQAKKALHKATDSTYTKLDMLVHLDMGTQILENELILSPSDTKAKLNVDAVVEAAYNYGRTGTRAERNKAKKLAQTTQYHISLDSYLNLDTGYIKDVLEDLGKKYSSTLSQPTATVTGDKPSMEQPEYDTSVVYQTLTIFTGTAEYGLNTDALYNQILDAYNTNLFELAFACSAVTPNFMDVDALFSTYCQVPVDAHIDAFYNITPEIYGYGFDLEFVRQEVAAAPLNTTLEFPMTFIRPEKTAEDLAGNLFQDIMGQAVTELPEDPDLIVNLTLACQALNGIILDPGARFSFNDTVVPTVHTGYKRVYCYTGKVYAEVVGGGISQVASTLYVSAIQADLLVLERFNHTYAPGFIDPGLDADVQQGFKDLKFTNNTNHPIRIEAKVENNQVKIQLQGTNTRDYTVKISYETVRTYRPVTLTQLLDPEEAGDYADGDVLVEGLTGYDVITYKTYIYKDSNKKDETEIAQSHYDKRNQVVIQIQEEAPTEPTEPLETVDPTVGETTAPTEEPTPED